MARECANPGPFFTPTSLLERMSVFAHLILFLETRDSVSLWRGTHRLRTMLTPLVVPLVHWNVMAISRMETQILDFVRHVFVGHSWDSATIRANRLTALNSLE